jgi:hypothetical protein
MSDLLIPGSFSAEYEDYSEVSFENDTVNKRTLLYDEIYELLKDKLVPGAKPFIEHCANYIDKNSESLVISSPYERLLFIETRDSNPVFSIYGITKKNISDIVRKSPEISESFKTLNNPLFFVLTGLNMFYRDLSKTPILRDAVNYSSLFMALRFYSSRQGHLWPYGSNRDIMEYTVNNLTEKYLLRKEKTILGVMKYIASDNDNNLGDRLYKSRSDKDFKNYISNLSTRINNFLRNIYNEWSKNVKDQKYMGSVSDRYDDEDKHIREIDNMSGEIYSIVNKVYNKMKSTPIEMSILRDASIAAHISINTILNTLEELIRHETDSIKNVITWILQLFLEDSKNKVEHIKSRYFMIYCLKVYRISNSTSKTLESLKKQLDEYLAIYGSQYLKLNRAASRSNFRKIIFQYVVACIIKFS